LKLFFVRHGDPDYELDSLTEKGFKEAEYLSDRLSKLDISDIYVSPLGRAKDTASFTLKKLNRSAVECSWLREFCAHIHKPNRPDEETIVWDWLPQDWTTDERYYSPDKWFETEIMRAGDVKREYDWVTENLDALLSEHGYVREGHIYRADRSNNDTLVFFCHFGVQCVMLSHLLGISPMPLWHGMCAAPSSVTTLNTEERRKGIACFRMSAFGDISHLYAKEEPPAFAARFCESFVNSCERHD